MRHNIKTEKLKSQYRYEIMQKSTLQIKIKNKNKNAFQIVYFITSIYILLTVLKFFEKKKYITFSDQLKRDLNVCS